MGDLAQWGRQHAAMPADIWVTIKDDVLLVDWPGPSPQAEHALRRLRSERGRRPILVLLDDDDTTVLVRAFDCGADDVFPRGRDPRELAARIGALSRRAGRDAASLRCGPLRIDLHERRVWRDGRAIAMPAREFRLLAHLAREPGRLMPAAVLRREIWGIAFDPGTNSVAVHVSRLRARIDQGYAWPMLRSVRGQGYGLFAEPPDPAGLTGR